MEIGESIDKEEMKKYEEAKLRAMQAVAAGNGAQNPAGAAARNTAAQNADPQATNKEGE